MLILVSDRLGMFKIPDSAAKPVDILSVGVNEILWFKNRNSKRGEVVIIEKRSPGENEEVGEVGRWGGGGSGREEGGIRGLRITGNKVRISFPRTGAEKSLYWFRPL